MPATETSAASTPGAQPSNHITEDEASLYDRQIRLWGLDAQNRMRNSTVLVLSLRSLAHETIKNLVLAGIGRLIIMDGEKVTEEDLGGGFLFREEEGAVGTERTAAALPQIKSLNPLVEVTALPTLEPFVGGDETAMITFLKREKVDVVVACDLSYAQMEAIDAAAHAAHTKFYGAGTYGFYGYVFADLGTHHSFTYTPPGKGAVKEVIRYRSMVQAFDRTNWALTHEKTSEGGSPFGGYRRVLKARQYAPEVAVPVLALWEFEKKHGTLPAGREGQAKELAEITSELQTALGVHPKLLSSSADVVSHFVVHATDYFPPTLAIVGGLLAQDVLRSISRNGWPIVNLLVVDSLRGTATSSPWGVAPDPTPP
ncbi:hypothetical protein CC85DRAFT_284417 [Cutaneotrichosporon oleaginosum]|uniref:THIF-type NAD/FAD binding fold domain-containing protein n=1 Tax=Cutaneotrichosporon oleaginosum TaxID=879819 RepID=A0A0J0XQZ4_9TREE|nr:uncharacterized protein CC85DRAFT_284417 [Cutaneotrichosporon oleaginosum]KLT43495.1 hypothetical protein CC85DRAFT_284417 [Cutaneotrichosporon oleaginosum]TXT05603.1 hypothetical protein COLE_06923 [Cutaneotrichosporon oleaginosum]